ncbi:MAG: LemA family protein [Eubacteriales bacterium]
MFKYYLLKIRYFLACLLAVILIGASVVVGGAVGLTNDRKDAIEDYKGGFFDDGIQELLVHRADSMRQLVQLFSENLPEQSGQSAPVQDFISRVQNGSYDEALAASQRSAEKAVAVMTELLKDTELSFSDEATLLNITAQLEENHREIIDSSYNQAAVQFNNEISKFPGELYAKYLSLEPLPQFE